MKIKQGDFVTIKDNTPTEVGPIINGLGGEVMVVVEETGECMIALDAPSMNALTNEYLANCAQKELEAQMAIFKIDDVELIDERRDTEEAFEKAMEELFNKMKILQTSIEFMLDERIEGWTAAFRESSFFEVLTEQQQEYADLIVETFLDFSYRKEMVDPDEWDTHTVNQVCLLWVPSEMFGEEELFESYGDILTQFLYFLGETEKITNAEVLAEEAQKIKADIPSANNDPDNWSMQKVIAMKAMDDGVDIHNEEELGAYLAKLDRMVMQSAEDNRNAPRPAQEDPFKGIGRNQRVKVQYTDGKTMEIKFKKVERDLREGKCSLV
ncbi:MAG: hypothetical protein AAGG75_28675 [Bacteroidota bacterium]